MRTKYSTTAIVLARTSVAEASTLVTLLTADLGVVRARAQSLRTSGAKLAPALQTFCESDVILVRGKEMWRLSGAVLGIDHFSALAPAARERAGRIASLILRLVHGEDATDPVMFDMFRGLLAALPQYAEDDADAAECLAALRLMHAVGVDAGEVPGAFGSYDAESIAWARDNRPRIIARINTGIAMSGL